MANYLRAASLWLKIALACMALGILLYVIGFATPSWKTFEGKIAQPRPLPSFYGKIKAGLWQQDYCDRSRCQTSSYSDRTTNSYHQATQAMACIALIGFGLALLTFLLYLCVDSARRRDFLHATILFTFVGALFAVICFALAVSSSDDNRYMAPKHIGWSMGLAITGTILYGIAGIMIILQLLGC